MRVGTLALALALLLGGCGNDGSLSFTAEDDGSQMSVDAGSRFTVELPGNPSTGYDWQVVELDETIVRLVGQAFDAESTLVGAPGTVTLTFEAVAAGTTDVHLAYERAFEDAEPQGEFSLGVTVE